MEAGAFGVHRCRRGERVVQWSRSGRVAMTQGPHVATPRFVASLMSDAEANEALGRWSLARECHEETLRQLPRDADPRIVARIVRRVARCFIECANPSAALDAALVARTTSEH